jgi:RNA recognition motif-containing protein
VIAHITFPSLSHNAAIAARKVLKLFMGTNLYVGNLSFDVTDDQLAQVFSRAGTVTSARVITDKYSGQSRGFGFVEMSTEAETAKAISLLNGQDLGGRALTVNESRPREERGARRSDGYAGGYNDNRRSGGGRNRF